MAGRTYSVVRVTWALDGAVAIAEVVPKGDRRQMRAVKRIDIPWRELPQGHDAALAAVLRLLADRLETDSLHGCRVERLSDDLVRSPTLDV